jgi:hypothetical protein
MSRYLERAENLARMLDVSYSLSLMPQDGRGDGLHELAMPLLITGTLDDYLERHGELHAERLLHFSPWMRPTRRASTAASAARASAHAVRGRITADMWENINATWLEIRGIAEQGLSRYGMSRFCEWIKERSHLFRGASYGTIMRNDAFRFIRLGTFIERADNTLRLLDARYEMAGDQAEAVSDGTAHAYYQWSALLRALSSSRPTPRFIATHPAPGMWPSCCCCAPMCRARCGRAPKKSTRSSPSCREPTAVPRNAWRRKWTRDCATPASTKSSTKACTPGSPTSSRWCASWATRFTVLTWRRHETFH